ncbi:hypothetical protein GIB67_042438 [Kingdonia uniflora]|uniref:ZF-HD dimerization-type domain-containing protein n=1 Tax=Kingdonia uniflora TaxID=39325 RepID=A0A7J7M2D6_9MAGN|nr:hypothetical protein GIB67_042438 [Kingdonia uniflora]
MDLRGQEKRVGMPISMSFNHHPIRESVSTSVVVGGVERRRDGGGATTGNGTSMFSSSSQTLDHHHHQVHQVHQHQHQHQHQHPPPPPPPQLQPPHHTQQQQQVRVAISESESDSDPDPETDPVPIPFPVSIALAGATSVTPITVGSKSRPPKPRYRECLKNHAASIGGHVVDGCGEFMPNGEEGTPGSLKCAACDCHRNFHRKEVDGEPRSGPNCYHCYTPNNNSNNARRSRVLPQALPAPSPFGTLPLHAPGPIPPMMMTFGGGGGTESSSEERNVYQSNVGTSQQQQQPPFALSKKRFRTKFSQDQKEKMVGFAEKIGWRFQKQDEELVQQFCAETGVKRQVLKVWMHNNKHIMKKKEP